MRWLALIPTVLLLGACGGGGETLTIYLKQRLGADGPPGQSAPVLMPVEREFVTGVAPERQAIIALRQGPSPEERANGLADTVDPGTWLRSIEVEDGVATVDLTGEEPDLYGSAAIVYSLTEAPGIQAVRLRLDGEPCCVYTTTIPSKPVRRPLTRDSLANWQGAPCPLRTQPDAVRCRG